MAEKLYPCEENLGKNCKFWSLDIGSTGCNFPKAELIGRLSCEGIIDDVCLCLKDGIRPERMTDKQMVELRTRTSLDNTSIPPGSY